jgi:hypothetical protein
MRFAPVLLAAVVSSALTACDHSESTSTLSPRATLASGSSGFLTKQPAQARALLPQAEVKPIITSGDPLTGVDPSEGEYALWAGIPDGLGAYRDGESLILHSNHELTATGIATGQRPANDRAFKNARVSRLVIDLATLAVTGGSYPVKGSYLLERLCSATWADEDDGFAPGYFLAGEDGSDAEGLANHRRRQGQVHHGTPLARPHRARERGGRAGLPRQDRADGVG